MIIDEDILYCFQQTAKVYVIVNVLHGYFGKVYSVCRMWHLIEAGQVCLCLVTRKHGVIKLLFLLHSTCTVVILQILWWDDIFEKTFNKTHYTAIVLKLSY